MARFLLCLAAAACCCFCLALLPPPGQGRRLAGLATGALGRRRLHMLLPAVPERPPFVPTEPAASEQQRQRGVPVRKTRPTWSPAAAAAGSVRPELRAVPGGPDPLHHHGGSPSRRPEQDHRTPSP